MDHFDDIVKSKTTHFKFNKQEEFKNSIDAEDVYTKFI